MNKPRIRRATIIGLILLIAGATYYFQFFNRDIYNSENSVKLVSRVEGENLTYYRDGKWHKQFLYGVNLGATTPGHQPGELSPTYADYMRWFKGMEELGAQLVRVYTVLPPDFYRALAEHNRVAEHTLWLVQGIWSPEEELISQRNAYNPEVTNKFQKEISLAVRAVYGQGKITPIPGKASGNYTTNVAPYLFAWMVGTEWEPNMVDNTNRMNPSKNIFRGQYFHASAQASPFEAWLAQTLDRLAMLESEHGWQHPISFTNWVTTDPLMHPNEPFEKEDLVSVDPMHIKSTSNWQAGYFAAYHVYPYYPDSLRLQQDYIDYHNKNGDPEPYEAYLQQLKKHHSGIPLVIAEFGVPSSRGMAHRGSLDRNQGMHQEDDQGQMINSMFQAMRNADIAGGIVFAWQDEWFKHTWNTMDLEIPAERRSIWQNRLTNEENFGLVAVEPGDITRVYLDGKDDDWKDIDAAEKIEGGSQIKLTVSSDEAYLYLALEKPVAWDWQKEDLLLAFDNQSGGNANLSPSGPQLAIGAELLLAINNSKEGVLNVTSAYDQHTYQYGPVLDMIPFSSSWGQENNGMFLPCKLCISRELYLPATRQTIPFDEIEIGRMHSGNSDPNSPDYDSLADFFAGEKLIEIRIPWMMLGYTDPSTHQVWSYPYRQNLKYFTSTTSPGLNIQAITINKATAQISQQEKAVAYNWENWDIPSYHERNKQSFDLVKSFIARSK